MVSRFATVQAFYWPWKTRPGQLAQARKRRLPSINPVCVLNVTHGRDEPALGDLLLSVSDARCRDPDLTPTASER
jgi:hypothetical protein